MLAAIPPMIGTGYLNLARLETLWASLQAASRAEIAADGGDVQVWLRQKHPSWNLVGRVCFHLADNKNNPEVPFAFPATYAARIAAVAGTASTARTGLA